MEISRDQFIQALIGYFGNEILNARKSPYGIACEEIMTKLADLSNIQKRIGKGGQLVHIGHTFGPFGFKVK